MEFPAIHHMCQEQSRGGGAVWASDQDSRRHTAGPQHSVFWKPSSCFLAPPVRQAIEEP